MKTILISFLLSVILPVNIYGFEQVIADNIDHLNLKYDYKTSFKKPYLLNNEVPGFEKAEGTILTDNFLRLSSSVSGSRGSLWSTEPNQYKDWLVQYSFQITGRNPHGKDGIAFWYTKDRLQSGGILGSKDEWEGLGVLADTYDKVKNAVSPYFLGILNDGTKKIGDTKNIMTQMFGGCYRDFRNTLHPVYVRVSYVDRVLKVAVDSVQKGKSFTNCFEKHDLDLPTGYYFGFSASSAHPADDHDLFEFSVYEVNPEVPEHDMNRPYEQQVVEKEGKFGINKRLREKMALLRKKIKEAKNDSDSDGDNEDTINEEEDDETFIKETSIQQTQFNIIESLNSLHSKIQELDQKVINNPSNFNRNNDNNNNQQNNQHLNDKLNHELKLIKTKLEDLSHYQTTIQTIINQMEQKQKDSFIQINNLVINLDAKLERISHSSNNNHFSVASKLEDLYSFLSYGFYLLAIILVAVFIFNSLKDRLFKQEKKYL
ncbi:concanavalin A-like lectin/glucanase [Neoconidiobolus thromboides FSU 785]|nr:concanavalin A-like lectin/glucanase [Neoconidiobolus thromboides FSU 785]